MTRTRIMAPSDEELLKLGEDLLIWANKPDSLFMAQFYSCEKHILRKDWKNIIQRMPFVPYYEEAQIIIGTRHLTGALKEGIAHRFIRLYHHDVREDDDAVAAAKNKANSQVITGEELIKAIREDMNARTKEQSVRGIPPASESDLAPK